MIINLENKVNSIAESILKFSLLGAQGPLKTTKTKKNNLKKSINSLLPGQISNTINKFIDEEFYTDVENSSEGNDTNSEKEIDVDESFSNV
jgi:hypothetical protein